MTITNFIIFFIFVVVISLTLLLTAILNHDDFTTVFAIFITIVGIFITVRFAIDMRTPPANEEPTASSTPTHISCGIK